MPPVSKQSFPSACVSLELHESSSVVHLWLLLASFLHILQKIESTVRILELIPNYVVIVFRKRELFNIV